MIYDRPYMRSDYERREVSALTWILALTIGGFLIQTILREWFQVDIARFLGLSLPGISSWFIWTPATYALLHSANPLHIIGNLICVYFLGREVIQVLGNRRFIGLYVGAVLLGGLAWLPVAALLKTSSPLVGCSAAVFALLTVFACFNPHRPITLLLFFILPVTVKPKNLALAAAGISAFFFLFFEVFGKSGIAHSSHLAGMLAGYLYFRFVHSRMAEFSSVRSNIEMPAWLSRKKKSAASDTTYKVNLSAPRDIKAEVDRILDKINSQGFGALTDDERRVLDDARDVLNKR